MATSNKSSSTNLPPYKADLLKACLDANSLSFGTFTLKSGRISPYFFNAGSLHTGSLLSTLCHAFAVTISSHQDADSNFKFDVLFGPAYKGIPLATSTAVALHTLNTSRHADISYAFNRKTAKSYGDGGSIVGAPLKGKRVLIVDDVITAGTAIREAFDIIQSQGGTVVGVVVALDRQEKAPPPPGGAGVEIGDDDGRPRMSAIGEVRRNYNVPVLAVLTLDDIIEGYKSLGSAEDIKGLEAYREKYRASD